MRKQSRTFTKHCHRLHRIFLFILISLACNSAFSQTTISFDAESFTPGQEIPDGHSFSAIGKSFNIYAGTFNGGVSGEGGMWYDPGDGSVSWNTFPTEFGDGGFILLDHTTDINRRWYDPEALIIKTTDGSDFKFTSFKSHDAGWQSWGNYLKITGYKGGVELGSESVVIVSDVEPYHSTVTLTDPVFDSVDEVRITLDKDNHPDYPYNGDTDMDGLYQSFDTFVIDNAVASNTAPTITTSIASSITDSGATLGGNVTSDGGATVSARGFVYSSSDNTPTIGETGVTQVTDGSGTGAFNETISGLSASTTYYYQAYATNSEGTTYGGVVSFATESAGVLLSSSPTLTFTENTSEITGDNIATDGEGGSMKISDINIDVFNISNISGSLQSSLEWKSNTFLVSNDGSFSGLTDPNTGSKGMSIKSSDGSEFKLIQFEYYNWGESSSFTNTIVGYRDGGQVATTTFNGYDSGYLPQTVSLGPAFSNVDEVRFYISAGGYEGSQAYTNHTINDIQVSSPVAVDTDATLTAAGGVTEPVSLSSTDDTVVEAVDVFDFTISDGGGGDGMATTISQIVLNVSGTSTGVERSQITWRLNGPNASNVTGTYNAGTGKITFSGLSISVVDGGNETYTINAHFNDNTGLTEDHAIILSVDGDTDLTVGGSGTQMVSGQSAVTNGSGTTIDILATQLVFTTQPAGSVSGSALGTQPVVSAQDVFGNTDVDFTETVNLTEASAGSLFGDVDVAAVSGVATFTDVVYAATSDQESFTLTANDEDGNGTDLSTVDANSVTSDVVATKLSFTTEPAPTSVQDGLQTSFTTQPVVAAMDANGIVDTGYSTDIILTEANGAGSATLSGTGDTDGNGATVSITPSSGVSTFTGLQITYNVSGSSDETFNLQASSGGLTTANSTQLTAIVNTAPIVDANTGLTITEGETGNIDSGKLHFNDDETGDDAQLTATITSTVAHGTLFLDANLNNSFDAGEEDLMVSATFTQDDVNNDRLRYTNTVADQTSDSFGFTLSDPDGGELADQTFTITINLLEVPTVATTAASGIAHTTATLGGEVTDNGGATVTERGIVYNTTGTPNVDDDTKVQIGSGDGSFSGEITGLDPGTEFFVRAYAITNEGTGYGSEVSFTTTSNDTPSGSVITNQSECINGSVTGLALTITDTFPGDNTFMVTATSSNTSVVANADIIITGSGNTRSLAITPVLDAAGTSTITVSIEDSLGEIGTQTFDVTFNDLIPPTLTAVSDTEEDLDASCDFTVPDYTGLTTATDNCGTASVTQSPIAGTVISGHGTVQTITLTADDGNGNTDSTTFDVILVDATAPTLTIQNVTIQLNETGSASITVEDFMVDSYDGCSIESISIDRTDFDCADLGDYPIMIVATDTNGNTKTETAILTLAGEDTDGDSIADSCDTDNDNDGTPDDEDAFPLDETEDTDTDGDGIGNNSDTDDDKDGTPDDEDAFPLDETEDTDTDGDGIGNNSDTDDDNDGTPDDEDAFPLDEAEDTDTDGDGIGNNSDTDDDNDGTPDDEDAFPLDETEDTDTDGDGIGNNSDTDDDNDGTPDDEDAFPLDETEDTDTDSDGIGNNSDTDDDNDGDSDEDELANNTDPLDDTSFFVPGEEDTPVTPTLVPAQAFTPNGDGNNDAWIIPGIEDYPNNRVSVYNRWGHEVLATKSYNNDWEGFYKGRSEKLPAGSYLYVIDLGDGSAPLQGWIFINY